jgi:hypothetical protein
MFGGVLPATAMMAGCLISLAAATLAGLPGRASLGYWLDPRAAATADAARQIAFLREQPGPAMCEDLALCFWAGKPPEVDVFNTGQQILLGRLDDAPLAADVARGHYAVIQMDRSPRVLSEAVSRSISTGYVVDHDAFDRLFLVPRSDRSLRAPSSGLAAPRASSYPQWVRVRP